MITEFRIRDKDTGLIIGFEVLQDDQWHHYDVSSIDGSVSELRKGLSDLEGAREQYSGVNDKEGKRIYRTDIIELDKSFGDMIGAGRKYCLVDFDQGAFMIGRSDVDPYHMNTYLWLVARNCRIVGNLADSKAKLEFGIDINQN